MSTVFVPLKGLNFTQQSGFTSHLGSLETQGEAFILWCLSFSTCKMNVKKVASQIEYKYEEMLLQSTFQKRVYKCLIIIFPLLKT